MRMDQLGSSSRSSPEILTAAFAVAASEQSDKTLAVVAVPLGVAVVADMVPNHSPLVTAGKVPNHSPLVTPGTVPSHSPVVAMVPRSNQGGNNTVHCNMDNKVDTGSSTRSATAPSQAPGSI